MAKRMTSKERLLAAIRHEEPDYVPVGPRTWVWLLERYGSASWMYELKAAQEFAYDPIMHIPSPFPNYISDLTASYEELNDVQVDLHLKRYENSTALVRTFHTPAGTLTDRLARLKPGVGYGMDPDPHWEERLVKSTSDLACLPFLLPQPTPQDYLDLVAIQDEVGTRGLVNFYVNSAIDHGAGWCMDIEDLMVASIKQPELVRGLLSIFHEYTMAQTKCALEAGVEVIFCPFYFASLSVGWSPGFYRDFILPLVQEQVALVHAAERLYHYYDDGKVTKILPWLAECGVDLLSTLPPPPVGDVDLAEVKSTYGDRICFNGNIDIVNVIKHGTPDLIREQVRQAILAAAEGGGFVLGTSDSIREAPQENVAAFFRAGRDYGCYRRLGQA